MKGRPPRHTLNVQIKTHNRKLGLTWSSTLPLTALHQALWLFYISCSCDSSFISVRWSDELQRLWIAVSWASESNQYALWFFSTGTYVTQVTATDADDPTYGNSARVVYSILHGQPYFSVDPKTGDVPTRSHRRLCRRVICVSSTFEVPDFS